MSVSRSSPRRVMVITTSDETLGAFFGQQLAFLASRDFEMHAVCSPGPGLDAIRGKGVATVHPIRMERRPRPLRDLLSLLSLWLLILHVRPHIVHAHTPKAGLLGMLAATLAAVPVRLYTIHGLPLVTRTGWLRRMLVLFERLSCALATRAYTVSSSVRDVALGLRLCPPHKLITLGDGSCAGIDLDRFDPSSDRDRRIANVRRQFAIPQHATVLTFVGRVAHDKGIGILAEAWQLLAPQFPRLHLLICGALDVTDPVAPEVLDRLRHDDRVRFTSGWVEDVPAIYCASTLMVLPTFREGLPQVALESAAMQVPIVASRVPGVVNSVDDGITGILVPPYQPAPLADAIAALLSNRARLETMGLAGRRFITDRFSQDRVNNLVLADYRSLLSGSGVALQPQKWPPCPGQPPTTI